MTPPLNFHGTEVHFVGTLITSFCTLCDPLHGFQSQSGSLTCTLTCLHAVNLRVKSGAPDTPITISRGQTALIFGYVVNKQACLF